MIDYTALLIVFGSIFCGAAVIGYPIGFMLGQRHQLRQDAGEPMPVRAARQRLSRKVVE